MMPHILTVAGFLQTDLAALVIREPLPLDVRIEVDSFWSRFSA